MAMRIMRLYGPQDMRLEEEPRPEPGPGEALVRVRAVGVCGSDVHYYVDGHIGTSVPTFPFVLGHEFAGEIAALGPGTEGPPVGTRVAVDPAVPCMRCEVCLEGNPNCCPHVRFPGSAPVEGALADYYLHPAHLCEPIPDSMGFDDGAMLEPLGVNVHMLTLAKIRPGDTVAILGAGPIGALALQLSVHSTAGAVYVSEPIAERRALAQELGATAVCDPSESDVVEWLRDETDGRLADIVIEAAWGGESVGQAVELARPAGKVVLAGIPRDDSVTFAASSARRKGLSVLMVRRMKFVYRQAIALVERDVVDLQRLITHRFPLEKAAQAFDTVASFREGVVKAMIEL
jgi:L-iditol 2-dehydrogenase